MKWKWCTFEDMGLQNSDLDELLFISRKRFLDKLGIRNGYIRYNKEKNKIEVFYKENDNAKRN